MRNTAENNGIENKIEPVKINIKINENSVTPIQDDTMKTGKDLLKKIEEYANKITVEDYINANNSGEIPGEIITKWSDENNSKTMKPLKIFEKISYYVFVRLFNQFMTTEKMYFETPQGLAEWKGRLVDIANKRASEILCLLQTHEIPKSRRDPNNQTAKRLFLSLARYDKEGGLQVSLTENIYKNGKKKPIQIETQIKALLGGRFTDKPLTPFDREVLFACIAIQDSSEEYTTLTTIFRTMTGIGSKRKISAKLKENIIQSLNKLMTTQFSGNYTDLVKAAGYTTNEKEGITAKYRGVLLPLEQLTITNDKKDRQETYLHFMQTSPLLRIAKLQNGQILTYPVKLLNIPTISNTQRNIVLKGYLLRRVLETQGKSGKKLGKTILIETIYKELGFKSPPNRSTKHDIIKTIQAILNYWREKKIIQTYDIKKDQRGSYEKIIFKNPN